MLGGPLCFALAGMSALAACGGSQAPTSEENRQLDEAGQLLNEAPGTLDKVDDSGLSGAANDGSGAAPPS